MDYKRAKKSKNVIDLRKPVLYQKFVHQQGYKYLKDYQAEPRPKSSLNKQFTRNDMVGISPSRKRVARGDRYK